MNKNELKEIAKKVKDRYFNERLKDHNEELLKLGRIVVLGEDNEGVIPTEEEQGRIENFIIKEGSPAWNRMCDDYDVDKMSNHSYITSFGFNISEHCEDLKEANYEIMKTFMFDENYKFIDALCSTSHDKSNVKAVDTDKVDEEIINNYKNCKYLIRVHNHPRSFCAIPSIPDLKMNELDTEKFKEKGIVFLADCVITKYDFFSTNKL